MCQRMACAPQVLRRRRNSGVLHSSVLDLRTMELEALLTLLFPPYHLQASTMQSSKQPVRPKSLNWTQQSHTCVFIRNLKLLQLDLQPDWPDITVSSLSPSLQNQRQRIRVVEWALYHLVALWDPKLAHDVCDYLHLLSKKRMNLTSYRCLETPPFLPSVGAATIGQSSCRSISSTFRSEEEWRSWPGNYLPQVHVGRLQRGEGR